MSYQEFNTEQWVGHLHPSLAEKLKTKDPIFRLTGRSHRFYFTKANKDAPVTVYNSGTTLIGNYRDMEGERALENYRIGLINSGKDPEVVLKTRQDYGTLMHIIFGRILMGETTTFETLENFVIQASTEARLDKAYTTQLVKSHLTEFKKDVAAFLAWIRDYKIEPLGVEVVMKSDRHKVATPLDLICYATVKVKGFWGEVYKSGVKKGQPKETYKEEKQLIIVDFKSGKKGFWDKNVLQLLLSKGIFEENFPDMEIQGVYNFAPNDWKKDPSYKFYNQERESKNIDYLKKLKDNIFERGRIEFEEKLSQKTERMFSGTIDFNNPDVSGITTDSLYDVADSFYKNEYLPGQDQVVDFKKKYKIKSSEDVEKVLENMKVKELMNVSELTNIPFVSLTDFTQRIKNQLNA